MLKGSFFSFPVRKVPLKAFKEDTAFRLNLVQPEGEQRNQDHLPSKATPTQKLRDLWGDTTLTIVPK